MVAPSMTAHPLLPMLLTPAIHQEHRLARHQVPGPTAASPSEAVAPWAGPGRRRAPPVLPLLGLVDTECAQLVQAAHRAGFRPQLCASPWQLASLAQAESAGLVVVQAVAISMSPLRLLDTLRLLSPLRVALAGPEPGSLAHAMALDLGFDDVWPQSLQGSLLETALARAYAGAPAERTRATPATPATPSIPAGSERAAQAAQFATCAHSGHGVVVDLATHSCTAAGRVVALPPDCARLLHNLLMSYPVAMPRAGLAQAMGLAVNASLPLGRRIDMTASRLRSRLQQAGLWQLRITATWGVGYRLEVLGAETC